MRPTESQFYFKRDIANILRAIDAASASLDSIQAAEVAVYRKGVQDTLKAVAEACGVKWQEIRWRENE